MKTIVVTVSDDRFGSKGGKYRETQIKIKQIFENNPQFNIDQVFDFQFQDIDRLFMLDNYNLLSQTDAALNGRLYKPYFIEKALSNLDEGDFLLYTDSSPEIWDMPADSKFSHLFDMDIMRNLCHQNGGWLSTFVKWSDQNLQPGELGKHTHKNFTTDRCMKRMGMLCYQNCYMHASGMILIQKNERTAQLVKEWLYFNTIDECSSLGKASIPFDYSYWDYSEEYKKLGHRHDQSISGLLVNHYGFNLVDIPNQHWGMNPHNPLQYCRKDVTYIMIDPNKDIMSEQEIKNRPLQRGDRVKNKQGTELYLLEIRKQENKPDKYIVGLHPQSAYAAEVGDLERV